ncbi:MAG TPA: glycosyltransferase [Niabella sp.]|nr:glycosyltransferase [Niabella sp.]
MTIHCFTSITNNYLPRARVLGKTLKKHNPNWIFHVVLSEPPDEAIQIHNEPFDSIVNIHELGIKNSSSWLFKHNVTETCTAVKASACKYIIQHYNTNKIVYFDPDIAVFSNLNEINRLLDKFPIILTPHQTELNTKESEFFHDINFMRCGIFNLGFVAINYHEQGKDFLDWWDERLKDFCYDEPELGLFTDQRWCDLVPMFFENTHILKDIGCNVSPWNIARRQLRREADGTLFVKDSPLRFFHFSKYGGLNYQQAAMENSSNNPVVVELINWYQRQLIENGEDEFQKRIWFYDRFYNGAPISLTMRKYYRENPELEVCFPDPFDTSLNGGFSGWWMNHNEEHNTPDDKENSTLPTRVTTNETLQKYDKNTFNLRKICESPHSGQHQVEISIIIPFSEKTLATTLECVNSILNSESDESYEIILITNNSSLEFYNKNLPKHIKYIASSTGKNTLEMYKIGARHAEGQYLIFLNNLTEVTKNWLSYLKKTFIHFPQTGIATTKTINLHTNTSRLGGILDNAKSPSMIGKGTEVNSPDINYSQKIDFAIENIMIAKSLWIQVGEINQNLPEHIAYLDLCIKVHYAGYEIRNQPCAEIFSCDNENDISEILNYERDYPNLFKSLKNISTERKFSTNGHILYVDDRIPNPDTSGGGLYSYNCIRILKNLGYNVALIGVWEHEWKNKQQVIKNFQSLGVEVLYKPYAMDIKHHIAKKGYQYDYIIICRGPAADLFLQILRDYAPQAKIIFNTIDLHFVRLERAAQITKNKEDISAAKIMREVELDVIKQVDATMVVSSVEKPMLEKLVPSSKIALIPIPVDIPGRLKEFSERQHIVFLGGYDHLPNVDAIKYFVKEIWPKISQRLPDVKFMIAGNKMPDEFSSFASETVQLVGFVKDLQELYSSCRLSVVPLRFGAGVKGKILTSMSFGVPNVVTSIGAEGMNLTHDENVIIADTPDNFANAVINTYTQPDTWQKISDNGLQYVQETASLSAVSQQFHNLLSSF